MHGQNTANFGASRAPITLRARHQKDKLYQKRISSWKIRFRFVTEKGAKSMAGTICQPVCNLTMVCDLSHLPVRDVGTETEIDLATKTCWKIETTRYTSRKVYRAVITFKMGWWLHRNGRKKWRQTSQKIGKLIVDHERRFERRWDRLSNSAKKTSELNRGELHFVPFIFRYFVPFIS